MNSPSFRIIPRVDIKGPNLVKGIKLEGLRALGDPAYFINHYFKCCADEIIIQDVVASLYGRNNLSFIIDKITNNNFIPITVGGGIRTLDDIEKILKSGADKISLNSHALKDGNFINQASKTFGSSTISLSIESIKVDNNYFASYDNGREVTNTKVIDWVKKAQDLGVGEIIYTSVDNEGLGRGVDEEIIYQIRKSVKVPLIYHGGIGSFENVYTCYKLGCNGVAIASSLHYNYLKNYGTKYNEEKEGNFEFLKNNSISISKSINLFSIEELKKFLISKKTNIRSC